MSLEPDDYVERAIALLSAAIEERSTGTLVLSRAVLADLDVDEVVGVAACLAALTVSTIRQFGRDPVAIVQGVGLDLQRRRRR